VERKRRFFFFILLILALNISAGIILAQKGLNSFLGREIEATSSALIAPADSINEPSTELTEPSDKNIDHSLEKVLQEQEIDGWPVKNVLKFGIRKAINRGVSANTIVLLLLFPMTAALVAFSRNVIGVKGFGIFTPAVISVAFLSTGIPAGIVLFSTILLASNLSRTLIKKVRISYLPRMAVLIWTVSLAILVLLTLLPIIRLGTLADVGIFPMLLFILLAETFTEAQITRTVRTAAMMTVETIILALIAYILMSAFVIQKLVLLHPEAAASAILLVDYAIGRYKGLRLLEIWKFRELLKD